MRTLARLLVIAATIAPQAAFALDPGKVPPITLGTGSTGDASIFSSTGVGPNLRFLSDRMRDLPATLADFPGFDPTGNTSSSAAMNAWLSSTALTGGTLLIRDTDKVLLDQNVALVQGQRIIGRFNPRDVQGTTGSSSGFANAGGIRLANGSSIRLDNGGYLEKLLIYRQGLAFDVAQDFSTWTGTGVVLGYGNDQTLRDVMVLGFHDGVASMPARGLNGNGRVVIDGLYLDNYNSLRLVGSYDTTFVDRVRGFCFVTQYYKGSPASGEGYDPRKDRRPGIGFQWLDRSDGTKIGRIEMFGYLTNYDTNTASWSAGHLSSDYPTTSTYTSAGTGSVGMSFRADTDTSSGTSRVTDFDPSAASILTSWSSEKGIVISGNAGRRLKAALVEIVNTYGDGLTINGGGVDFPVFQGALIGGKPVTFAKAPDTPSRIAGRVTQFGPGRNSQGSSPIVSTPSGSLARLLDLRIASDHPASSVYFDNVPVPDTIASADPITLPPTQGKEMDSFIVTGTANAAGMYGDAGARRVRLAFQNALTLYAGNYTGGFNVPSGGLSIPAGSSVQFDYNGATQRWDVIGKSF